MEKVYLATRSELSDQIINQTSIGFICYRVRASCECRPLLSPERNMRANQRNGVLVIDRDLCTKLFVKCKSCAVNQKTV